MRIFIALVTLVGALFTSSVSYGSDAASIVKSDVYVLCEDVLNMDVDSVVHYIPSNGDVQTFGLATGWFFDSHLKHFTYESNHMLNKAVKHGRLLSSLIRTNYVSNYWLVESRLLC